MTIRKYARHHQRKRNIWPKLYAVWNSKIPLPRTRYQVPVPIMVVSLALLALLLIALRRPRPVPGQLLLVPDPTRAYAYVGDITQAGMKASLGTKDGAINIKVERQNSSIELASSVPHVSIHKDGAASAEYSGSDKDIIFRYGLTATGLKEDVVLKKKPTTNKFVTLLKTKNLVINKTSAGLPVFTNQDGVYQFHFAKPYAEDASGNRTYGVRYSIAPTLETASKIMGASTNLTRRQTIKGLGFEDGTLTESTYTVTMEVDPKWLSDPARIYPVTIDPTVTHNTSAVFATGEFNRGKDTGSGSSPNLTTYFHELPTDANTAGLWHMNETSGATVTDSSGFGNNGTANGTTFNTSNPILGAAARSFAGNPNYITFSNVPLNTVAGQYNTVEFWMLWDGSVAAIMPMGWSPGGAFYDLYLFNSSCFGFNTGNGEVLGTTTTIPINQWVHVAAIFFNGIPSVANGSKIYINGVEQSLSYCTGTAGLARNLSSSFFVSGTDSSVNFKWRGSIDELRITAGIRAPEEIKADAQRRPYSVFTSPVMDLGPFITSAFNGLSWDELGEKTGDGETASISAGLVTQWNFNETSGNVASVASGSCGSSCNGFLVGFNDLSAQDALATGSGWTSLQRRWGAGALMFDGVNDYVDAGSNSSLKFSITQPFTVTAWVKAPPDTTNRIIMGNSFSSTPGYHLRLTTTNNVRFIVLQSGTIFKYVDSSLPLGPGWNYLVGEWDGNGTASLYVNGVQSTVSMVSSGSLTSITSTANFNIGNITGQTGYFKGTMDALSVYSRALPVSEILSNYNAANIEFQTRVGNTTTPDDGTWDAWSPISSETQIDSMDNVQGWATPSAGIWPNVPIATSSSTFIKQEGNGALRANIGQDTIDPSTIDMFHFDDTGASISEATVGSTGASGTGADGNLTVTAAKNINTDIIGPSRSTYADGIAYKVDMTVSAGNLPNTGNTAILTVDTPSGLAANDEVLLINMQGAAGDVADVGNYEFRTIQSIATKTITFTSSVVNHYSGTTATNQKVILQRVPNYQNVTLSGSGSLTAGAWDGLTTTPTGSAGYNTGIVAVRANGTVSVGTGTTITTTGKGYRSGRQSIDNTCSANVATENGESLAPSAISTSANNGGSGGVAAVVAAFGGTTFIQSTAGYATVGTAGTAGNSRTPGAVGGVVGGNDLTKIFLGSGGGGGINCGAGPPGGALFASGTQSGGIVILFGSIINVAGSITSSGTTGSAAYAVGASAGGSVYLSAPTVNIGIGLVTAAGGTATNVTTVSGSVGRIRIDASNLTGTSTPPAAGSNSGEINGTGTGRGIIGQARTFNGSSDFIAPPVKNTLNFGASDFTFEFWFYDTGSTNGSGIISMGNPAGGCEANLIYFNANTLYYYSNSTSGSCGAWDIVSALVIGTVPVNQWAHFAVTRTGSLFATYKNGVLQNTASNAGTSYNPIAFNIGRRVNSAAFIKGSLDELRISSRSRTGNEIAEDYRLGRDHRLDLTLPTTDLSGTVSKVPFWVAADRPGRYLEATVGQSAFANNKPDANTVGLWHLEEFEDPPVSPFQNSRKSFDDTFPGVTLSYLWTKFDPNNNKISVNNGLVLTAGTVAAWDSGVISNQSFTNTKNHILYAKFTTGSSVAAPNNMMIGWGQDQFASASFTTISHALYWTAGTFSIYQDGSQTAALIGPAYVANTTYEIRLTLNANSGTCKYEIKGGTFTDWTVLYAADNAKTNNSFRAQVAQYQHTGTFNEIAVYTDNNLKDASGNGNHASQTPTSQVQGAIGKAVKLGTSDYIDAGNITGANGLSAMTVSAWVNEAALALNMTIAAKWDFQTGGSWALQTGQNSNSDFRAFIATSLTDNGSGFNCETTDANITANQWYFVTMVFDGSGSGNAGRFKLYLNGRQLTCTFTGTAPATLQTTAASVKFGKFGGSLTRFFNGALDEIRIDNVARTPDQIRQAYEISKRTHPIVIDFNASLGSTNLISNSSDLSFDVNATTSGAFNNAEFLYPGDKLVVKEVYNGTEYLAQGTVATVNHTTGATTLTAWDSGSTFPAGGFSPNATVFKWQKEWVDITGAFNPNLTSQTMLTIRSTDGSMGENVWLDDLRSGGPYLATPTGSTITSSIGRRYFQYRAILSSSDTNLSASLTDVTFAYTSNSAPNIPSLDAPTNGATSQILSPLLKTTATDPDSDYLRYKIQLCTDSAMTLNCQTFDQTISQTGWSGQNTQSSTAYTSGTQATFTIQTPLQPGTTYYWKSSAIDPAGTNTFGSTQASPFSFTTNTFPTAPTALLTNGSTNPSNVLPASTPFFSAIFNDPDPSDTTTQAQIQVSTDPTVATVTHWNSGTITIASTAVGARSPNINYAGATLQANTTFYWHIRFIDSQGNVGAWSAPAQFSTVPGLIVPPCTLNKAADNTSITVQWTDVNSTEDGYTVEKNTDSGGFGALTTTAANASSYVDSAVSSGHTYAYRVRAFTTTGSQVSDWCYSTTLSVQISSQTGGGLQFY